MPIYEYRCADCAHELEIMQKMSDESLTQCPECGHHSLSKLISRSSFRLKGGGWYETDFKNVNPPQKKAEPSAEKPKEAESPTPEKSSTESTVKSELTSNKKEPTQKASTKGDE